MDISDVRHDTVRHRFELSVDGETAFTHYRLDGGRMVITHTEVPEAFKGHGVGSLLAKTALEHAKAQGLSVVPRCPFVASYIEKHPEYQALVASDG